MDINFIKLTLKMCALANPHFDNSCVDYLYHLGLNSSHDLKEQFQDVKFVCMGGSPDRAEELAKRLSENLGYKSEPFGTNERFALFKVGPVLSVSHGMGMPSMSILLHEMAKLLVHHVGIKKPIFLRIGTSGGLGVEKGTVVVASGALAGDLRHEHVTWILGKPVSRPAVLDAALASEILECGKSLKDVRVETGVTLGTDDFYEGQARLDGAIGTHNDEEKMEFLEKLMGLGVRNIEMESVQFAAFCHHVGIPAAIICCTLLNRLIIDKVDSTHEELETFSLNAQRVAIAFIKKRLGL